MTNLCCRQFEKFIFIMETIDKLVDKTYLELKNTYGGDKNSYFGLIYLENEYRLPRAKAINQIAFNNNDLGIDGFHFDLERRNFYIFQFKNTTSHAVFKDSLIQLTEKGIENVFSGIPDRTSNQLIKQLRSNIIENRSLINQVCIRFIFNGEPEEAEKSQVLDKLKEDLENKKYYIDKFFGDRQVILVAEFRSFSGKVGNVSNQQRTHTYKLSLKQVFPTHGPTNEVMHVGLIKLLDLFHIYKDMGKRFFERNIRYGLGSGEAVNKAIMKSLKDIVFEGKELPENFMFNHNGVTLYAEILRQNADENYSIIAPRILNGAQTITTFAEFIDSNIDGNKLKLNDKTLNSIYVLCKIITQANQDFITRVTICNNRQNPVEPWNLHANDLIQLQLQDKFKEEVGIYYERQENAFENIDVEEEGFIDAKALELLKMTQTFLITEGNIQRIANMRQIFEEENLYNNVFSENRLKADCRYIVLCYKIHMRLRKLLGDIMDKGYNKYAYLPKARHLLWALLCQAVLNDDKLEELAAQFGTNMITSNAYIDYLSNLATTRCRFLLSELTNQEKYSSKINEGNFSFLRTNAAFEFCMETAKNKWNWTHKKLNSR